MKLLTLLVVIVFLSACIHRGCAAQPFGEPQNLLLPAAAGGAAAALTIEAVVAYASPESDNVIPAYKRAGIGGAVLGAIGFLAHNFLQQDPVVKWVGPCVVGATIGFIKGRYFEPVYKPGADNTNLLIASTVGSTLFAMSGVGGVYLFNWLTSS
jgi:hypothetical protein